MRATVFLLSSLAFATVSGQEPHRSNSIPVDLGGIDGVHAWSGGMNSTQWSKMDVDSDGVEDIVVFDRSSEQISILIADPLTESYRLDFEYQEAFPEVDDWMLLRDYNCDGLKDIFAYAPGGIQLFENVTNGNGLEFELRSPLIFSYYDYGTDPFYTNLYVSGVDIPSIDDFDGDGDLDIHTFTLAGLTIEYHESFASDIGDCDSLDWRLRNRCYGMIGEDAISPTLYIGQEFQDGGYCSFNVPDPKSGGDSDTRSGRHAGSTICTFDYDGNGQKDILLGDISATNMVLAFIDDRGPLQDSAFQVELDFPTNDVPVDIKVFNAGFYEDLDMDGVKDLLVSPANRVDSEDKESAWFYKNSGSDDAPVFNLQTTSLVQGASIDVGTLSFPRFVDADGDGDQDLIIGNRGKFQEDGTYEESLHLYDNIGSPESAEFQWLDSDFQDLTELGFQGHMAPCFGDLDGDEDMDCYLGDGIGKLHYLENTAGAGNPIEFASPVILELDGEQLDLGANLIPQLFDLDGDGLLDLLVGERNGNINYLRNEGSISVPDFVLVEDSIGDIVTDLDGNLVGYSAPWFFRTENEMVNALIGTEAGTLLLIEDVPSDPFVTWAVSDEMAYDVFNGTRACPVTTDLDGDGLLDIVNGNQSGGLGLYLTGPEPQSIGEPSAYSGWSIYPNPSTEGVLIIEPKWDSLHPSAYIIRDVSGRSVMSGTISDAGPNDLDVSPLSSGIYLIQLQRLGREETLRFVIQ